MILCVSTAEANGVIQADVRPLGEGLKMSTQFLNVCDSAGVCEIDLDHFLLYRKYLIVCLDGIDCISIGNL